MLVQMKKMTENKVISRAQLALQVEASEQSLLDESDLIIHELNQKLSTLRQQLVRYEHQRQPVDVNGQQRQLQRQLAQQAAQLQELQAEQATQRFQTRFLPQSLKALQAPASQLQTQVEQLLEKIPDPEVRQALEHCRELAQQMLEEADTRQQQLEEIQQDYQPEKRAVDLLKFFRSVARQHTQQQKQPLRLFASPRLPAELPLDPNGVRRALLALLQEVRRHAHEPLQLLLQTSPAERPQRDQIQITMKVTEASELARANSWNDYLTQRMEEADANAELLIGRKIIQAHGGQIQLRREEDRVVGLEVQLPLDLTTQKRTTDGKKSSQADPALPGRS